MSLFAPAPIHIGKGSLLRGFHAKGKPTYLQGSCLLIRASAFEATGGLDPDFFLYGDDIDFMIRLRKKGFSERLNANTYVLHEKSSATGEYSPRYIYTALRSNLIVLRKHARWYHWPTALPATLAISLVLVARSSARKKPGGLNAVARAWRDFISGRWGGYDGTWPPNDEWRVIEPATARAL
jgi:GT2 family glycosyltransferase